MAFSLKSLKKTAPISEVRNVIRVKELYYGQNCNSLYEKALAIGQEIILMQQQREATHHLSQLMPNDNFLLWETKDLKIADYFNVADDFPFPWTQEVLQKFALAGESLPITFYKDGDFRSFDSRYKLGTHEKWLERYKKNIYDASWKNLWHQLNNDVKDLIESRTFRSELKSITYVDNHFELATFDHQLIITDVLYWGESPHKFLQLLKKNVVIPQNVLSYCEKVFMGSVFALKLLVKKNKNLLQLDGQENEDGEKKIQEDSMVFQMPSSNNISGFDRPDKLDLDLHGLMQNTAIVRSRYFIPMTMTSDQGYFVLDRASQIGDSLELFKVFLLITEKEYTEEKIYEDCKQIKKQLKKIFHLTEQAIIQETLHCLSDYFPLHENTSLVDQKFWNQSLIFTHDFYFDPISN